MRICFSLLIVASLTYPGPAFPQSPPASIAVMPLEGNIHDTASLGALANRLVAEITGTGQFNVLERSRTDSVLAQQGLQYTGCADTVCAVGIGKLLNARFVLLGKVQQLGGLLSMDLRMVDVGLSRIARSVVVDCQDCPFEALVSDGARAAAAQLASPANPQASGPISVVVKMRPRSRETPDTPSPNERNLDGRNQGATSLSQLSAYYIGVNGSFSTRTGYYDFPAAQATQDSARSNLWMFGDNLGRRYSLLPWLRLQVGGDINFGSVVEDTLPGNAYFVSHSIFDAGIDPELQFVLGSSGSATPYIRLGGGLDFVRFREHFYGVGNPSQEVAFTDLPAIVSSRWCPHVHAGAGIDIIKRKEIGVSLGYAFRYWYPVKYGETRDLPLTSISYSEVFFTHMLFVQILLGLSD